MWGKNIFRVFFWKVWTCARQLYSNYPVSVSNNFDYKLVNGLSTFLLIWIFTKLYEFSLYLLLFIGVIFYIFYILALNLDLRISIEVPTKLFLLVKAIIRLIALELLKYAALQYAKIISVIDVMFHPISFTVENPLPVQKILRKFLKKSLNKSFEIQSKT